MLSFYKWTEENIHLQFNEIKVADKAQGLENSIFSGVKKVPS